MNKTAESLAAAANALGVTDGKLDQVLALQRGLELVWLARALTALCPAARSAEWVRQPNKAFEVRSGLQMLLSDDVDDAEHVRRYAEYWANNGW